MTRRRYQRMMGRALKLARSHHDLTGDNPSVGCVITNAFGHIVGAGVTAIGGRPHAEQIALDLAGDKANGGTAYVTLEPCRERSTGEDACSKRLIDAGIARVVCAIADEHPNGAGGFDVLREAGIPIMVGLKRDAALPLYKWFFEAHSG